MREMEGFVLAQNQSMLRLATRLGIQHRARTRDDPSIRRLTLAG